MGTNYYWYEKKQCECCGREYEPVHIGKSSYGWHFALHVELEEFCIYTLEDWRNQFFVKESYIKDEYGHIVSTKEMIDIITQRGVENKIDWSQDKLDKNHAERGKNNLLCSRVDGKHCVGHGDGPWDYIEGEFS